MTVETTLLERLHEVTVRVHVLGAEERNKPYTKKVYLPRMCQITYQWASTATADQTPRVELSGPRVLKRGLGEHEAERLWGRDDWPDWVRALVEAHRPPADELAGGAR